MKSLEPSPHNARLRTASAALSPPAPAWWWHVLLALLLGGAAALLIHYQVVKIPGVHWHTAVILGLSLAELLWSCLGILLVWTWRSSVSAGEGWPLRAYEEFNTWLIESKSPLDKRSLRESARLLTDGVEQQVAFNYIYCALVGIILTVPACLSFLFVAGQEARAIDFSRFWLPFAIVIAASTLTLLISGGTFLLVKGALGIWLVDTCERRSMAVAGVIQDHSPGHHFGSASPAAGAPAPARSDQESDPVISPANHGIVVAMAPDDSWADDSEADEYAEPTPVQDDDPQDAEEWKAPEKAVRRSPFGA